MDSALRGNWAAEVAVRRRARRGPVALVVALPEQDRRTANGVVWERGQPIATVMADDPRHRPTSSRPADHLRSAGITMVADGVPNGWPQPSERPTLRRWLRDPSDGVMVIDAATSAELEHIGSTLRRHPEVLVVGTAPALAAWVSSRRPGMVATVPSRSGAPGVVVVVGSAHARARAQAASLRARLDRRVTVLTAPDMVGGTVDPAAAGAVAAELAARAHEALAALPGAALVVIGGDTAAAVLGDAPRLVIGSLPGGVTLSVGLDGGTRLVATRAGSFGDDDALVGLVARMRNSTEG
ncbi:MAG: four-carbon acid sugar kinase family protein [Desertimonas sp.]